jgi:acetyltransferase
VRPIGPDDEPLVRAFHEALSETSVYNRYAHVVRLSDRITHAYLIRSCFVDYERQMALVALPAAPAQPAIVAIGRLIKSHDEDEAEFALAVSDRYQGHGIGTELLRRLIGFGRAEGIRRIVGYILAQNSAMLGVCRELGFSIRYADRDSMVTATLELKRGA